MDDTSWGRKRVGARIKRRRTALNLPLATAARRLPISRWTWMRWESGDSSVPAELLAPLCRLLDCEVAWLVSEVDDDVAEAA